MGDDLQTPATPPTGTPDSPDAIADISKNACHNIHPEEKRDMISGSGDKLYEGRFEGERGTHEGVNMVPGDKFDREELRRVKVELERELLKVKRLIRMSGRKNKKRGR
jgi:hypothetical protein